MRCPYCGARRTEVLKTVLPWPQLVSPPTMPHCGSRFSTQERPVRWSRVERKWPGPRPSRKGWRSERTPALRGKCEVETCGVDFQLAGIGRHVDHIVPARLIRRLRVGNPNRREDLQCICATCHGYKLQADHKLCLGNQLSYLETLHLHTLPQESLTFQRDPPAERSPPSGTFSSTIRIATPVTLPTISA
jgi:hypothetical protein